MTCHEEPAANTTQAFHPVPHLFARLASPRYATYQIDPSAPFPMAHGPWMAKVY